MLRRGRQPFFSISPIVRATAIIETWPLTESDAPKVQASRCDPTMTHSSGAIAPGILPATSIRRRWAYSIWSFMWIFAGPGPT